MPAELMDAAVDDAILSVVSPRALKVAMVIVKASDVLVERGLTKVEDRFADRAWDRIGERIQSLAGQGRLIGRGDLSRPGPSEVTRVKDGE